MAWASFLYRMSSCLFLTIYWGFYYYNFPGDALKIFFQCHEAHMHPQWFSLAIGSVWVIASSLVGPPVASTQWSQCLDLWGIECPGTHAWLPTAHAHLMSPRCPRMWAPSTNLSFSHLSHPVSVFSYCTHTWQLHIRDLYLSWLWILPAETRLVVYFN